MDSTFKPQEHENTIIEFWEKKKFAAGSNGKPYTVLMPPPNTNASLHAGHGMYTIDDIVVRYMRLRGYSSVWIPGLDHAGIETQFVYEKYLAKQGKSRLDFDRQTLYNDIFSFAKENSGLIYTQFKRLGFLADWDRSVFSLDKHVVERVYETFKKMVDEGIVYRDNYMVNYCTYCGTSLAELEVEHVERIDGLYYMKYGPFVVATVRPETKFGDTAVAVNPKDKRYAKYVGKEIEVDGLIGKFKLTVIADDFVDPKFGTGVVKVTPAHDPNDFEMGKRHNLEVKQVIDLDGRLNANSGPYEGLKVKAARIKISQDLQTKGLMEKVDTTYNHAVAVCYKCKRDLEPMVIPNWFVKVKDLKQKVIDVVKKDAVSFHPKKYKKDMLAWLNIMHDWPISRQNIWGIRIPIWYDTKSNTDNIWVWWLDAKKEKHYGKLALFLDNHVPLSEIEAGLQKVSVATGEYTPPFIVSQTKPGADYLPETDTFDTWYSSGQWPLVTLKEDELKSRYPMDFLGTLSDILRFWVSRMIMFSLYVRDEIPFKHVYLWSLVADSKGVKMSKSKGNVVNPLDYVNQFGADAFRASLVFGTSQGGQINLAQEKVIGMRNFTNKLWNIGRFIFLSSKPQDTNSNETEKIQDPNEIKKTLDALQKEFDLLQKKYITYMDSFQFGPALGELYEFIWHRFADYYIEQLKVELKHGNIEVLGELKKVFLKAIVDLHPFMPFVTEALWKIFHTDDRSILEEKLS